MSSSSDVKTCPLCVGKMDDTDIEYSACSCGYQICLFCYNKIKVQSKPLCPACRKPYDPKPQQLSTNNSQNSSHHISQNEANHHNNSHSHSQINSKSSSTNNKQTKNSKIKSKNNYNDNDIGNQLANHQSLSYDELSSIRVRQRNLVYVVGLPIQLMDESVLKTKQWFGKYGKIKKIYCNKKNISSSSHNINKIRHSFAAFITYYKEKDALNCIQSMNGYYLSEYDGRMLRATTGSTKYCSYFVRGNQCTNPLCAYLHDWAKINDVVTKEELNDFGPINQYQSSYAHSHSHSHSIINSNNNININSIINNHIQHSYMNNNNDVDYDDDHDGNNNNNKELIDSNNEHHTDTNNNIWHRNRSNSMNSSSNKQRITLITSNKNKSLNKDPTISKFDYTRIVKKGLNDNKLNPNAATTATTTTEKKEFPPLGGSGNGIGIIKNKNHLKSTTPEPVGGNNKQTKITTTPPLPSSSSSSSSHENKHIRTKPPMNFNINKRRTTQHINNHNINHISLQSQPSQLSTSKSEKLTSNNNNKFHHQPPKISLEEYDIKIQSKFNNYSQNIHLNHSKVVNFDSSVDIVGGGLHKNNKIYIESKVNVKQIKNHQKQIHIRNKNHKNHKNHLNNRLLAQLFLDELLKHRDSQLQNNMIDNNEYQTFKMSDLLKDGFNDDDDELIINYSDYNYYFLQSDDFIYQQFYHHWNYLRRQQKSKA